MILIVRMKNRCRKRRKVTRKSGDLEHKPLRLTEMVKKNLAILLKVVLNF